jgi:hypothetical protein
MAKLKIYLIDKRCNKAIAVIVVNFLLFLRRK